MIIKNMTATFGCLNGRKLALEDGLNVICAPNESGKSTWCAFIRAMLYGIDSSERAKGGRLPDKTRYAPWSGALPAGTMEITHGGREITLRRSTKNAAYPMREFKAVYTGTEEPVSGLTGAGAGQILTGVSREVFRRSAFIEQGEVTVTADTELEKRIASIVSSGEEGVSYTEADARLRVWQRKRRYRNTGGAIPELEKEAEAKRGLLECLSRSRAEQERLLEELEQSRRDSAALAERIAAARDAWRREVLTGLERAREHERESTAAQEAAAKAAAVKRADLERGVFGAMTPDEAAETAEADAEKAEGLLRAADKRVSARPVVLAIILCFLAAALGFAYDWYFFPISAVMAVGAALLWARYSAAGKNALACAAAREEILRKYAVRSEAEIYAAADAHARNWEDHQKAAAAVERAKAVLASARAAHENAQALLIRGEEPEIILKLQREQAALDSRAAAVGTRLSELTGSHQALGDPMVIESGLEDLRERRSELEAQFDAIDLAVSVLKEADEEIRSRFSPALSRTAAGYMSRLTGGRYDELTLSRDFTAAARLAGDAVPHETAYLSAGAADLLYLSVRLAVCELVLPREDPCPLVLDDALINLDPERAEAAMEVLKEIAQRRQVILFTCK